MSSSGMKGVDAGDGRALAENLQLGAQGTAKVRASAASGGGGADRVREMESDETLRFSSEEGAAITNNNNTTKLSSAPSMNYREAPRPNSPVGPGGGQEGDAEQDYRSVFNRLPSPCRPDSPVLPPIDYAADRIQNDLLDEICSDMGIKDDMDFDFFDFEVNPSNQQPLTNHFDSDGSLDQVIQFGQSSECADELPTPCAATGSANYGAPQPPAPVSTSTPHSAAARPPGMAAIPQSPSSSQQRRGSQSSDSGSHGGAPGADHLQRMAQLNASIAASPAKNVAASHASQPSNQLQKGKMEGPPPSPKPGMPNQAGLPAVVPSSPSLKHRPSSQMPSAHNGAKQGHYQGNGATMGQQPLGGRTDIGNAPYPGRTPGLHAQSGRSLTSPYDHGYFSIGSNAGPGSHESFESCIPRITPPPEEQSSNDKVLQYLGQQSGHPRMGAQNQGVGVMPGRQGMPGHLSAGTGSSGTMPQFNTQMPPQQQLPQHGPPDQMFNYRAPPQQQQQPHHMRGVTPHYNQGPGADGFNYTPRTPKTNLQGTPFSSQTSQGFNFEHPMSQRYSSSFGNNPYYGQSQMGQQTPRGVNGYGGQGSAGMMHGATGGAYPNFGSNQSSPDGYERSSMSRAKKQRLDNNAYQSKPQGLQYEPPTTLRQPLVDMKNARMLSSVRPHPSQGPGTMQQQQQGNHMYPGSVHTPHQHHMRGQYPQFNQQHVQQNQFQQRSQGVYGPQTPGYMGQMPANSQMQQGPNTHHQPHNGPPMNPTPMQNSANCGNKPGMSVSQSYASLQAQLPPYQPGTQDFVQHLVTDRSSAFRSHPLFPLLRDLVIADMNFHDPTFPFQLISNLPADFNKLLQNYMQRNPASANHHANEAVDNVIMDALRYAHTTFIEKIACRKQQSGDGPKPFHAIEEFCERFDKAVKNSFGGAEAGTTLQHLGTAQEPNPTAKPPGSDSSAVNEQPSGNTTIAVNRMQQQQNNGVAPGSAGPSVNPANGQNHVQMHQNTVNPVVPGRPLSANAAAGPQWSNAHTGNTGHLPNTALPADTMQKQTNCASMPNLVNVPSVTQSVDLLADIMGETNTRLNGEPVQNSNCNNANGGSGTFVGMMSDALSSSMPCGLNTADGGGGQAPGAPPHSGGFSAGGGCPPAGAMQRHMSVPGAPTLLESGRPTSLPNVNEPPPTPPPDHLLVQLEHSKPPQPQLMGMYGNMSSAQSTSMPNLAQPPLAPVPQFARYLNHNSPSPLNDSMHSGGDSESMYSEHFTDIRPSPRKAEGHKKQVLPKEAVAIMLEWLKEHQDKPYPNDDEKDMLIRRTKLTMSQINYWFTNARRRILPKWTLQRLIEDQSASGKMNPITIKQCQQLLGTKSIKSIKEALQKDITLLTDAATTPSPGSDT